MNRAAPSRRVARGTRGSHLAAAQSKGGHAEGVARPPANLALLGATLCGVEALGELGEQLARLCWLPDLHELNRRCVESPSTSAITAGA